MSLTGLLVQPNAATGERQVLFDDPQQRLEALDGVAVIEVQGDSQADESHRVRVFVRPWNLEGVKVCGGHVGRKFDWVSMSVKWLERESFAPLRLAIHRNCKRRYMPGYRRQNPPLLEPGSQGAARCK